LTLLQLDYLDGGSSVDSPTAQDFGGRGDWYVLLIDLVFLFFLLLGLFRLLRPGETRDGAGLATG
jgi:hypothetical protein